MREVGLSSKRQDLGEDTTMFILGGGGFSAGVVGSGLAPFYMTVVSII